MLTLGNPLSRAVMFLTGNVDQRVIDKYEREAKERGRDSWYMAYIMDTNDEERAKGKTVEVGMAHFATDAKRLLSSMLQGTPTMYPT